MILPCSDWVYSKSSKTGTISCSPIVRPDKNDYIMNQTAISGLSEATWKTKKI